MLVLKNTCNFCVCLWPTPITHHHNHHYCLKWVKSCFLTCLGQHLQTWTCSMRSLGSEKGIHHSMFHWQCIVLDFQWRRVPIPVFKSLSIAIYLAVERKQPSNQCQQLKHLCCLRMSVSLVPSCQQWPVNKPMDHHSQIQVFLSSLWCPWQKWLFCLRPWKRKDSGWVRIECIKQKDVYKVAHIAGTKLYDKERKKEGGGGGISVHQVHEQRQKSFGSTGPSAALIHQYVLDHNYNCWCYSQKRTLFALWK